MKRKECWVIIPAYNEGRRIRNVVKAVRKQRFPFVVVNDGSTDSTGRIAEEENATVLHHALNLGKGSAMKTGAEYAIEHHAKALIFLDGDGQHDPGELRRFLKKLDTHSIVFGSRALRQDMPLERRMGRWLLQTVIRHVYDMDLQDPLVGYRAIRADAYPTIEWESHGYGVEVEMIARAGKHNLTYTEVPITTIYHERFKGMTVHEGLKIVFRLIWWRMTH